MEFKDYYHILGVPPEADAKNIKTAYRKRARQFHPDVSQHQDAEEKFKEANEAYEVLKDTEKRAEYDALRQYGGGGNEFKPPPGWKPAGAQQSGEYTEFSGDFSDFFSSVFGDGYSGEGAPPFGKGQGGRQRGQDVETDMPIFLEETLTTVSKPISYHLNGEDKTLQVMIPAGITDGERVRLKGQGMTGVAGADNGDLYLRIKLVPHPLFDVEYHDLILTLPLAPWEAALGAKIQIPTLTGKIQLTIPPNSQSGRRLRIRGRGLNSKTGRGDMYAVLKVVMPTTTNDEIKQHWQKLSEDAQFDPRSDWSK